MSNGPVQYLRYGPVSVAGFSGLTRAPAVHAALSRARVDAAVVDAAFLASPAHLAAALHRLRDLDGARATGGGGFAGRVFTALSLTHNLDRILTAMPAGSDTAAALVFFRAGSEAEQRERAAAVEAAVAAASEGGAVRSYPLTDPASYAERLDAARLMAHYSVSEADVGCALRGLTSADLLALPTPADRVRRALEVCVVNKLAIHGT